MNSKRGILLLLCLAIYVPLLNAGCLFQIRNSINHLLHSPEIERVSAQLKNFYSTAGEIAPLSTKDVEILTQISHGQNQDVFEVPGSDFVAKIPRWRNRNDPNFPSTFENYRLAELRHLPKKRHAEARFADFFPPAVHAETSDGFPITLQAKVKIPLTPFGKNKALKELISKLRERYPDLLYDAQEGFIIVSDGSNRYKFVDVWPKNIAYYNGSAVMMDCGVHILPQR